MSISEIQRWNQDYTTYSREEFALIPFDEIINKEDAIQISFKEEFFPATMTLTLPYKEASSTIFSSFVDIDLFRKHITDQTYLGKEPLNHYMTFNDRDLDTTAPPRSLERRFFDDKIRIESACMKSITHYRICFALLRSTVMMRELETYLSKELIQIVNHYLPMRDTPDGYTLEDAARAEAERARHASYAGTIADDFPYTSTWM